MKRAEDIGDDLEFITKADLGVEVVECIPGQGSAGQRVGVTHSVLWCQVDERRRARR